MILYLDYETRSEADLKKVGGYNYAAHPSTQVLMLGWAIDDGPVELWEPHEGMLPFPLWDAFRNPAVVKVAFNAAFERLITRHQMEFPTKISEWRDVQVMARYLSLPGHLASVCNALKMDEGKSKDAKSKKLINLFSKPFKGSFRDWNSHPREWEAFRSYCRQDVEVERALYRRFSSVPLPDAERELWFLSEEINDRGIPVSPDLPQKALDLVKRERKENTAALKELTGLENPNSDAQLMTWVDARGYPFGSLQKQYVTEALRIDATMPDKDTDPILLLTPECREALLLRQKLSRRSYTKIETLMRQTSADGRLRGQFKFMGAARTGRWSGAGVQVQNFSRPIKSVKNALQWTLDQIRIGDALQLKEEHGSVTDAVVSCLRSMLEAPAGKKFVVSDLNAIEPRVLGWVSGCQEINDVFAAGRCPYLSHAVHVYGMTYGELEEEYKSGNEERRQMMKPIFLGCGYALGGGSLYTNQFGDEVMGGLWGYAANMGVEMTPEFAKEMVEIYRATYPGVKTFWKRLEEAFKFVLRFGGMEYAGSYVYFTRLPMKSGGYIIQCHLPSGRCLHYFNPVIETETVTGNDGRPWTREQIYYEGIEHSAQFGAEGERLGAKVKWGRTKTYGGKLTENIVQAISRDILAEWMKAANAYCAPVVGHFHDELMLEADEKVNAQMLNEILQTPTWAPGLLLAAEGWEGRNYRK